MSRINPVKHSATRSVGLSHYDLTFGSRDWLRAITEVAQSIGQARFEQRLYLLLEQILHIDQIVVFTYTESEAPGHLFTRGKLSPEKAENLAHDYVNKYYERDPQFAAARGASSGDTIVSIHPKLSDGYDAEYHRHFFSEVDLIDKISTIKSGDEGTVYCNFYRMGESGPYSKEEQKLLNSVLPLITSLISAHFRIMRLTSADDCPESGNVARSLVHSVISRGAAPFDRLTVREAEICERILIGFTSTGISLDLGIATSSVNTYRRRAYEKLEISTQNELFSLCLEALNRIRR